MAPIQHISESHAKPLAVPETGAMSSCGSANTFLRMIFRTMIPENTNTILMPKSGFVPLVVASPISRQVPVTALSANPHHIQGYSRSIGLIGIFGEKPRSRRAMTKAKPATKAIPMPCRNKIVE